MTLGRTQAVALLGLQGAIVEVEADIASGLPRFIMIGLPDTAIRQAEHRVHAAAINSGCPLPTQKYTVNLSPAALPKFGAGFDLAIAIACLAAAGTVPAESIGRVVHLGELGLDGRLRPIVGILPAVLALARAGHTTVMVPTGNANEASLVPGVKVVGVASLRDAAIWHGADLAPEPVEAIQLTTAQSDSPNDETDLADIIGNEDAVDAMLAAAAGGHHVFLLGPPGAGKTMLAARLPGILPDLSPEAAIEVSSIRSLAGLPVAPTLDPRPPFENPHHTASAVALIGGGSGIIRPGAAARSSHGVLFLDEAPEFNVNALDALRQPLESGVISIHRANAVAHFPGSFQLVMAANPCPCGQWVAKDSTCTCAPFARRRYLARISGPLLDRIDIQLRVSRVTSTQLRLVDDTPRLTSTIARERVAKARGASGERLSRTPWRLNSQVPGAWLRAAPVRLSVSTTASIDRALERGAITMRGYDRVLRVTWIRNPRNIIRSMHAAIYLRQSLDVTEGIERQRERTKALLNARGWELSGEYEDNETSASKLRGKGTAWARLLEDIATGTVQAVVAVDLDRLLRSTRDLNTLIDLGAKVVTVDGQIDLSTADGEFRATMLAGIARFEVRRKSERQIRANEQRAKQGKRIGGSRRQFGYAKDGLTIIEREADAVRDGYNALLSGVPLAAIARDWNARGLVTTQKRQARSGHEGQPSPWAAYSVRQVLRNARNAGIVTHRGEELLTVNGADGAVKALKSSWKAIVEEPTYRAAVALLADPDRRTAGTSGKYLLTGIARCGVAGCGAHAHAGGAARPGVRAYRCSGSMGHFARMGDPIDEYVETAVIWRLSRPDARDLVLKPAESTKALRRKMRVIELNIAELVGSVAAGTFKAAEVQAPVEKLRTEYAALQDRVADAGKVNVLGPLIGDADIKAQWDKYSIDRKRAVVDFLMTVTLHPVGRGTRTFRSESVSIKWKRPLRKSSQSRTRGSAAPHPEKHF